MFPVWSNGGRARARARLFVTYLEENSPCARYGTSREARRRRCNTVKYRIYPAERQHQRFTMRKTPGGLTRGTNSRTHGWTKLGRNCRQSPSSTATTIGGTRSNWPPPAPVPEPIPVASAIGERCAWAYRPLRISIPAVARSIRTFVTVLRNVSAIFPRYLNY